MNTGFGTKDTTRPNANDNGIENIKNVGRVVEGEREIVVKDTSVKFIRNRFETIADEINEQHFKVRQQRHLLSDNKSTIESSGTSKLIHLSSDRIRGSPNVRSSGHKNKSARVNANILSHRTHNSPKNSPRQNRLMTQYFSPNSPRKKKKMNVNDTIRYFETRSIKEKEKETPATKSINSGTNVNPIAGNSKEKVVNVNVQKGEEKKVVNAFNLLMQPRDDTQKETSGKKKKSTEKEKSATDMKKSSKKREKKKKS